MITERKEERERERERKEPCVFAQEAVAVGAKMSVLEKDCVISAYRCHGFAVVFGVPARNVFAELMGRKTGVSRGKGGSMHMYANQFYGGDGIVGGQVEKY